MDEIMKERLQKAMIYCPEFPWNNPELLKNMAKPDEKYKTVSLYKKHGKNHGKKRKK